VLVPLAAVIAATTIPDNRPGVNFTIIALLVVAATWDTPSEAADPWNHALWGGALCIFVFFAVRAAEWLLVLNLLIGAGLFAVASAHARTWTQIALAPVRALLLLPRGLFASLSPLARHVRSVPGVGTRSVWRAGALAGGLLIVFGGLFLSADPAFAALTERFLVPEVDVGLLPARVLVAALCLAGAGALALSTEYAYTEPGSSWAGIAAARRPYQLRPVEWLPALLLMNALFAAFVLLQLAVIFGGHTRVLETTGLTYAQYARGGFFQLVAVAVLTLGLIAGAVRFAESEARTRLWLKGLLGGLCVLTLVILASALTRMNLYQEVYGFTHLRLLVEATILWLAAVFLAVLAAGAFWRGEWLPRTVLALGAAALLILNMNNPDALIAKRNIDRFERTGKIDLAYLARLSVDAVPALSALPEPQRTCVLARISSAPLEEEGPLTFNWGRERAYDVLRGLPAPGVAGSVECPLGL
jgi:hypothetical protein